MGIAIRFGGDYRLVSQGLQFGLVGTTVWFGGTTVWFGENYNLVW